MEKLINRRFRIILLQIIAIGTIFTAVLLTGPIDITFSTLFALVQGADIDPMFSEILLDFRMSKAITAMLSGAALAVSGILMQTYFNNFLAGPFVLGVHSGASLGVMLWIMSSSLLFSSFPQVFTLGLPFFAFAGACFVLSVLIVISPIINSKALLLVIGILFSYFVSGIIAVFIAAAEAYEIKAFLIWSLGSFDKLSGNQLVVFSSVIVVGLLLSFLLTPILNVISLGDRYAGSLGVSLKKVRIAIVFVTATLSGIVTAYAGPVAFIGVISPHITRYIFKTGDHRLLLPGTALTGAVIALFAELLISFDLGIALPLNAVLGIIGGPIVFVILWNSKKGSPF